MEDKNLNDEENEFWQKFIKAYEDVSDIEELKAKQSSRRKVIRTPKHVKAKKAFSQIVNRITGISFPIFGISWSPPQNEIEIAREVLIFLEDRRVLYVSFILESADQCALSVIKIRDFLTEEMMKLPDSSELYLSLADLRSACRKYLNANASKKKTKPIDKFEQYKSAWNLEHIERGKEHLAINLIELRKTFSDNVLKIALLYGLDIEGDLVTLIEWFHEDIKNLNFPKE